LHYKHEDSNFKLSYVVMKYASQLPALKIKPQSHFKDFDRKRCTIMRLNMRTISMHASENADSRVPLARVSLQSCLFLCKSGGL